MADLFDRFVGSAGLLTAHTADTGQTWGPSGTALAIDGSGGMEATQAPTPNGDFIALSSWTPPAADYAVSIVVGAGFRAAGNGIGLALRATVSGSIWTAAYVVYVTTGSPDQLQIWYFTNSMGGISGGSQVGTNQNLATQLAAGDTLTGKIVGNVIMVYRNGTSIYSATDGSSNLAAAGQAGVLLTCTGATANDVIRTLWAGAVASGPEALTIAPTAPSVPLSTTQSFALSTAFTNEGFSWGATHGSISGSAATETYTAPSSGTSDTVTGTSVDLPTRTASASVTLSGSSPTPTPTAGWFGFEGQWIKQTGTTRGYFDRPGDWKVSS